MWERIPHSLLSRAMSWKTPMTGETSLRMKFILLMIKGAFNPQRSPCPISGFLSTPRRKAAKHSIDCPCPKKPAKIINKTPPIFPFTPPFSIGSNVIRAFLLTSSPLLRHGSTSWSVSFARSPTTLPTRNFSKRA